MSDTYWERADNVSLGDHITFFGVVVKIEEMEDDWASTRPIGVGTPRIRFTSKRGGSVIFRADEHIQIR